MSIFDVDIDTKNITSVTLYISLLKCRWRENMKSRSETSMELYQLMLRRGYREEFCDIVTRNLNTDFTAKRMIGYLSHYQHPSLEEIADEMLAILSDRNRIMQKKDLEKINISWNNYMMQDFNENEG